MRFVNEIYNSPIGSFAICLALNNGKLKDDADYHHLRNKYWSAKRRKFKLDDPKLLYKVAKHFGYEYRPENIAMVMSDYNLLFAPYVQNEDGTVQVLPIREDGMMTKTLIEGKVYPLGAEDAEQGN